VFNGVGAGMDGRSGSLFMRDEDLIGDSGFWGF